MSSRPQSARAKYENYDLQADQPESALVLAPGTPPPAPRAAPSGDKGGNSHIDIFVRIKPQPRASQRLSYDATEGKVEFNLPREAAAGYVNNQREHYEFRFNGILGPEAKQDEVRSAWHSAAVSPCRCLATWPLRQGPQEHVAMPWLGTTPLATQLYPYSVPDVCVCLCA